MKRYPKVVLVGKTNVGKSALFNRLSDSSRSIVFDKDGVTRDYVHEVISWQGKTFDLIDSGGLPLGKQKDPILAAVQASVLELIDEADFLALICDGKNGLTEDDRRVAKLVHRAKKPSLLVINKADHKASEENKYEFVSLGFKDPVMVSALHGTGIAPFLEAVVASISDKVYEDQQSEFDISIVGKPNVGKSSLMNILMQKTRSIVSDVPGTTREAITEKIKFSNFSMQLTDTAGVRRKKKVTDDLEAIMVKSSLRSLKVSDLVILMVDVSEGELVDQELKLLFYAYEQKKCVLLIFNKTDLISSDARELLEDQLTRYDFILKKIPQIWTSCKDRKNVGKVLNLIQKIRVSCKQEFTPEKLDDILLNQIAVKPLYKSTNQLIVKRIRSLDYRVPTFSLKVNIPRFFGPDQLGFIENVLRRNYALKGCPVKFVLKKG